MKEIERIVATISDTESGLEVRHRAFAEIVTRYQDMAFGCAYAALGNADLAEEAAQEAFIVAWQKLPQLKQPAAFPGWFRQIVISQCGRQTRRKVIQSVPLSASLPLYAPDPYLALECDARKAAIWNAIRTLPNGIRLVTVLFYINQYSLIEVADFTELPLTTVKKRLHSARQQLEESLISMIEDNLPEQRPSLNNSFTEHVLLFTRGFSTMIDGGNSIVRSLFDLAQQQENPMLKEVLTIIRLDIEGGAMPSVAMSKHPNVFDQSYVNAVAHGEKNDLRETFRNLSK